MPGAYPRERNQSSSKVGGRFSSPSSHCIPGSCHWAGPKAALPGDPTAVTPSATFPWAHTWHCGDVVCQVTLPCHGSCMLPMHPKPPCASHGFSHTSHTSLCIPNSSYASNTSPLPLIHPPLHITYISLLQPSIPSIQPYGYSRHPPPCMSHLPYGYHTLHLCFTHPSHLMCPPSQSTHPWCTPGTSPHTLHPGTPSAFHTHIPAHSTNTPPCPLHHSCMSPTPPEHVTCIPFIPRDIPAFQPPQAMYHCL